MTLRPVCSKKATIEYLKIPDYLYDQSGEKVLKDFHRKVFMVLHLAIENTAFPNLRLRKEFINAI